MKKRLPILIIIFLLVTTTIFCGLWQHEKYNQADVEDLCQSGAAFAVTSLLEFKETGYESDYWHAVAEFRVFEQAYFKLSEGTNKSGNYIYCNEVYGYLVLSPEHSQEHVDEIIDVMKILADDATNGRGFQQMSNLRNTLNLNTLGN